MQTGLRHKPNRCDRATHMYQTLTDYTSISQMALEISIGKGIGSIPFGLDEQQIINQLGRPVAVFQIANFNASKLDRNFRSL